MAEGGVSLREDRFSCSVCFERFNKPKLLPCCHTFCVTCLDTYIATNGKNGKFNCPLCRSSISVPSNGADGFQSNFYIETEADPEENIAVECDLCGLEEGVHRCTDCEENLCPRCSKAHSKSKSSRLHVLIELSTLDSKAKRKIISREFCSEHSGQEVLFVCKQCDKVLCMVCKLTKHEAHTTTDVSSEANEIRKKLEEILQSSTVQTYLSKEKKKVTNAELLQEQIQDKLQQELKEVERQASAMHKIIDRIVQSVKQDLRKLYEIDRTKVKEEQSKINTNMKAKASLYDTAKLALDHDSDIGIVSKGNYLARELSDFDKVTCSTEFELHLKALFQAGMLEEGKISAMFGKFQKRSQLVPVSTKRSLAHIADRPFPTTMNLKLRTKITIPNAGEIIGVAPIGNGKAWIVGYFKTSVWLVNEEGKVEDDVALGASTSFVAANGRKEAIVSCYRPNCIKRIKTNGQIETIRNELSDFPHGIACRKTDTGAEEMVYSCTDNFFIQLMNCGFLTALNEGNESSIPTQCAVPFRIAVCPYSGNMCLVDYTNGEVFIYEKKGTLLGKYKELDWQPCAACFFSPTCIIVAAYDQGIMAIKTDGTKREVLKTGNGFKSLAIDGDTLWIGQNDGEIELYHIE